VTAPGAAQTYNNCGYYLLGRVLQRKRNAANAADAMMHLFDPLHITRIRNATTLVQNQPPSEARYQTATLSVGRSQMSDAMPLVPDEYGTEQMAVLEGAGGLSGAATDIARLIAILLDPADNPAMKRSTVVDMMNHAVANGAVSGHTRAGYGWDGAASQPGEKFYAQKGGSLSTDHSVIQINGDWGFTMLWAGEASAATGWYPDYPDVMSIAKTVQWSTDLFPAFGMPSL
jgi:CubicO group peptidase (beta-lactamase class C family)